MKRRNFLQAGSLLPFFPYTTFGKELFGENSTNSKNSTVRMPAMTNGISFTGRLMAGLGTYSVL